MKKLPFLFILFPLTCQAEVMDKEFSFLAVFFFTFAGSIASYFSARYKPWLLLLVLPILGLLTVAHLLEVTDPFVGPALAAKAGSVYIFLSWISPGLIFAFTGLGFF